MTNEEESPEILSCPRKFLLILWKNMCVLLGHKCQLACLLVSFLMPLIPILLSSIQQIVTYETNFGFKPRLLEDGVILCYSPQNEILELLIKGVSFSESEYVSGERTYHVQGFRDANGLGEALTKNYSYRGGYGIEFPDEWSDISELPNKFRFALRFPVNREDHFSTNILMSLSAKALQYRLSGFLILQTEISLKYLQKKNSTQAFTRPKLELLYDGNIFLVFMKVSGVLLMILFLFPFTLDVKSIVEEKELQLKDLLNISDVSNSLQWLAWYVKSMIILFILSLIITIFWTVVGLPGARNTPLLGMPAFPHTDWSVFLLYLLVCSHSLICFGFVVSAFCARSNWCAIIAILLFIASSLPNYVTDKDNTGTLLNILCSIFVVSAMSMVMDRIAVWEQAGLGLQWSNLFETSWARDSISVGAILILMILFSLISILVCLYMEKVRPGEFGMPQPWNFPCTKRFWCPTKSLSPPGRFPVRPSDEERPSDNSSERTTSKYVDARAKGKTAGVQIQNLSKSYGKRQVVDGLTFDMYENEIMVLLGHNGAGKTTTIQMLTGTIQPSSGTAIINGYDIQTEHLQARRSLGFCPQRSVFFSGLSVAGHLRFYSRLRGLKGAAVKQEVNKYLQKLNLTEKANTSARRLSGGTQRRLALACALCGHVKVLFCDEPSTGLDPSSRHDLWKLLLDEKRGRTILLTTHQMDEGEVLADRIAIISDGRLRCLGTLAFLKKQNETSYLLTCEKGPNCNVSRLTQLIASHVPNTRPHSNIGSDVSYRLPHRFLGSFGSLFNDLEQQQDQLDVVGFGLSSTSLAEIFMSHGAEDLGGGGGRGRTSGGGGSDQQRPGQSQSQSQRQSQEQSRYLNWFQRYLAQWEAMMLKKLLHIYDKKWIFLIIVLLPIIPYVVVLIRRSSGSALLSRLPITLADYQSDDVRVILQSTSDARPVRDIANAYQELAKPHCTVQRISQNVKDFVGPSVQDTPLRLYEMKRRLIAAATFDKETIAWCRSHLFPHSDPLSLSLAFNAMAKAMVGPDASIEVTNAPYEETSSIDEDITVYATVCICIMTYLSIVLPIFAISVAQEKVSQIRMQQQVSGVNLTTYWLTHYIVDLTLYFAFSLALTLAVHELCNPWDMLSILMIIGAAGLPFTYLLACRFRSAGTAVAVIININIIVGTVFAVMMIGIWPRLNGILFISPLINIFYLHPVFTGTFAVANCFIRIKQCQYLPAPLEQMEDLFKIYCTPGLTPGLSPNLPKVCPCRDIPDWVETRYMLISGLCYLLWLIFGEYCTMLCYGLTYFCTCCNKKETFKDSDVAAEVERVTKMSSADRKEQALVLNNVSKRFYTFSAVGGISFAVKPGVCFGLLGANGAGKTTTFKMIVGEIPMTAGKIHVRGWSLQFRPRAARKQLGYCPQHDTLFDFCTGRQTLRIFLLLRGTRRNLLREISEKLATDFGFLAHLDKKVKDYSGGTKRKLNAAVAGEGSSLVCLDEPSSGVDPASRRHVWNVLSSLRDKGKAVLLSSHSMEEVEALCSQLAIMVDGKIHCLGSQQRIKNKFAESLVLKLHVETGNLESLTYTVEKVKNQMASDFPKASLEEEFGGRLTYHIPTAKLRWSRVFSYVERNRSPWKLVDYSLSQPSVEDVFLDIAKKNAQEKAQQNIQNRQPRSLPTKKESTKSSEDSGRATSITKP